MKKRILAALLSICLLVGLLPTAAFADAATGGTWGGIDWTLSEDGTLTIAPTVNTITKTKPWSTTSPKELYEVGECPAAVNDAISNVTGWPFDSSKVKSIVIKEGVTSIGSFAFNKCANVSGELIVPSTVKYIGQEAFQNCKFTSLVFATRIENNERVSDLRCLAPGAFKKLAAKTVILPEGLECIHCWVFQDAPNLEYVSIPSSVTRMTDWTHVEYNGLENYYGKADYDHAKAIFSGTSQMKSITFGSESAKAAFNVGGLSAQGVNFSAHTDSLHYYTSGGLQDAIDAAAAGEGRRVVTLEANTQTSTAITIPEGVTLVIPADKTLTNAGCLINLGMIDGSGTFDNTSTYAETGSNISNTVIQTGSGTKTTAYTITYDLGGGTLESENPAVYCAASPDFTLKNPTRPGYTFKGWSGTGLGESESLTVTISSGSTGNRSYTANWVGNEYAVTLETDGGTIRSGNVSSYVCGVGADLPTNVTKDGYSFAGWYNNPEYSGTRVTKITDTDLGDKVFYAKWNKAQIVVILSYPPVIADCPNGSLAVSPANPTVGSTVTVTATPDEGFAAESVTVTAKNGESIAVTANADGTYSFVQPKGSVTVSASFAKIETSDPFDAFVDLNKDAWYRDGVRFAIESGLMVGIAEDQFAPAATASRAMIVTTLWRLAGEPETASDAAFADVDYKAWYGEAIRWAADIGIVEGYGSNLFGTTDDITREQLAVFLYRYERYMSEDSGETQTFDLDFADTESVSPWAQEALSWMVENGIMEGKDGNRLDPRGTATRAEIATVLFRYVTLKTQK